VAPVIGWINLTLCNVDKLNGKHGAALDGRCP
jgi:hypothetical protein